jgi:hypothetical protein
MNWAARLRNALNALPERALRELPILKANQRNASSQTIVDSLVSRFGTDTNHKYFAGMIYSFENGGSWPMDWVETFVDSTRPWGLH